MEVVTRGGFLKTPVRVDWDEKTSEWVWEEPSWFKAMGYYTLGTYVAHKLEQVTPTVPSRSFFFPKGTSDLPFPSSQALWRSYWQAHSLDPRKNPTRPLGKGKGTRERMYNFSPNTQGLHSKRHLISFWNSLTPNGMPTRFLLLR